VGATEGAEVNGPEVGALLGPVVGEVEGPVVGPAVGQVVGAAVETCDATMLLVVAITANMSDRRLEKEKTAIAAEKNW